MGPTAIVLETTTIPISESVPCQAVGPCAEVRSGGVVSRHFDDLDAVLEFDASDDFWRLVFTFQSPPGFVGGVDEFESA
jgi:hypothetical protein